MGKVLLEESVPLLFQKESKRKKISRSFHENYAAVNQSLQTAKILSMLLSFNKWASHAAVKFN